MMTNYSLITEKRNKIKIHSNLVLELDYFISCDDSPVKKTFLSCPAKDNTNTHRLVCSSPRN